MKMGSKRSSFGRGHKNETEPDDRPKLFGVCIVKNEEDIIADSVTHAADFCDRVFVVDNASTDRTWEIVNGLDLDNLVPVCSRDFVFRDYLRLRFMETRREELGIDNWWYIFDADEFVLEDPFEAIAHAEDEGADCIGMGMVNFYITIGEFRQMEKSGREETWRDRKYYILYESGKIEFIKNTRYLDYSVYDIIPLGLTKECSRRLPVRHYPYRSLIQLEKRVQTRYWNPEFESECRRGTELERYLIDPAAFPQLRILDEEGNIDLTGDFDHTVPRIGDSMRDRTFTVIIRTLYSLRLLRPFYAFYRRYAAWRQKVNVKNEPAF